jgi:hypothetical protein
MRHCGSHRLIVVGNPGDQQLWILHLLDSIPADYFPKTTHQRTINLVIRIASIRPQPSNAFSLEYKYLWLGKLSVE